MSTRHRGNTPTADMRGTGKGNYHRYIKKRKNRLERHAAKRDPEVQPGYGRYAGWES